MNINFHSVYYNVINCKFKQNCIVQYWAQHENNYYHNGTNFNTGASLMNYVYEVNILSNYYY